MTRTRLKKGSNQYKVRTSGHWKGHLAGFLILTTAVCGFASYYKSVGADKVYAQHTKELFISPIPFMDTLAFDKNGIKVLTPVEEQDWEGMKQMARNIASLYNFPVNVILSQMALESARGTSNYCVERNNCFGIAAYDSNPDAAWTFENKEQGMIEYVRLIRETFPEAWAERSNPDRMIELLVSNSSGLQYATDPDYVAKLKSLPEWSEK